MIRGLAIETSGRLGSIALLEDGRAVREDAFPHGLQHAAQMLVRIDALCRDIGWTARELDEVYVSAGPGSFTGLRIGITLAKTLGFATGVKLVAVPTVEVLARNAPADVHNVLIVLDAKRDQIFTARLIRGDAGEPFTYAEPAHLDSLAAMLARSGRPVYLIGEGVPHHKSFIPDDPGIRLASEFDWRARASSAGAIGYEMGRRGQWTEPDRLSPIYIRKPEAEEKWEQAHSAS